MAGAPSAWAGSIDADGERLLQHYDTVGYVVAFSMGS
jgi:hypothetical protein